MIINGDRNPRNSQQIGAFSLQYSKTPVDFRRKFSVMLSLVKRSEKIKTSPKTRVVLQKT